MTDVTPPRRHPMPIEPAENAIEYIARKSQCLHHVPAMRDCRYESGTPCACREEAETTHA